MPKDKKKLEKEYDQYIEVNWDYNRFKDEFVKRQPLHIEHGYGTEEGYGSVKLDFRGIRYLSDFHVYAPDTRVEVEMFDSKEREALLWLERDWNKREDIIIFFQEPTEPQIMFDEFTDKVVHLDDPETRRKRNDRE